MKKITLMLVAITAALTSFAQNIEGQWNGVLKIQNTQLAVVFNINKTTDGYTATMDSPNQGVKGIVVTTTSFKNAVLNLSITNAGIEYEGTLNNGTIEGAFIQGGQSFPLNLSREKSIKEKTLRPQEPLKPYSYYVEEVTFENKIDGITLAGTLTLPKKDGVFPVVILISGSGPQNRDEEILGHKPFLVLSDYLTKNGIGVLRYDDRGTALSKGNFKTATTADFAKDADAAVQYLKSRSEVNKSKIGLIGHSEGGVIAPIVANKSQDIRFIVLLAGTGLPGDQILLLQQELIGRASGVSEEELLKSKKINKGVFEIVAKSTNNEKLKTDLTNYIKQAMIDIPGFEKPKEMNEDDFVKIQVNQVTGVWMQNFIKYNPAIALEKVKCPVLALNGSKDLQVPAKVNLEAISKALAKGKNKNVTIKELPNLNHLFQECKTGSPSEYASIEQTFSPIALTEVLKWIQTQTK